MSFWHTQAELKWDPLHGYAFTKTLSSHKGFIAFAQAEKKKLDKHAGQKAHDVAKERRSTRIARGQKGEFHFRCLAGGNASFAQSLVRVKVTWTGTPKQKPTNEVVRDAVRASLIEQEIISSTQAASIGVSNVTIGSLIAVITLEQSLFERIGFTFPDLFLDGSPYNNARCEIVNKCFIVAPLDGKANGYSLLSGPDFKIKRCVPLFDTRLRLAIEKLDVEECAYLIVIEGIRAVDNKTMSSLAAAAAKMGDGRPAEILGMLQVCFSACASPMF